MTAKYLFLPVLLQVLLTLFMFIRLSGVKSRAVAQNQVDETRRALHADAWPDSVIQVNNNIRNQFETPVLFFVLVLVLWSLGAADALAQGVAWAYALSRVLHAFIHTGANVVPLRRRVFIFGVVMLLVMTGLAVKAVVVA